jgi:phosphatidate cytidylyltransferase
VTRVLSAGLLLALVVGTIWLLPTWATAALAVVAAAAGAGELAGMAAHAGAPVPRWFVAAAAGLVVAAFLLHAVPLGPGGEPLVAILLALVIAAATLTLALGPPSPATLTRAAVMTMAPLYLGLPLGVIAWVQWGIGPAALSWLLAIIAISDSAQYYTGRAFGRTRLAPIVSPSKTREGAAGGLIVAAIAGCLLGPLCLPTIPALGSAGMAAALALFGIVGDLFESALKRSVGLKDSSTLIPGHGGILDRIDSHLFAAPAFYLAMRYLA